ncbi:MAG: type II methionyl aminopeptidase [Candidatus Hodarchaeales archaeon]
MSYTELDIENLHKSGDLLTKIFRKIVPQITPGRKVTDIVDSIELLVEKYDAQMAFPVNLSSNAIAAHDTAAIIDNRVIPEKGYFKLDFGVSVDNCLTDCARTIPLGDVSLELVEASKAGLEAAIRKAKPGMKVGEIGESIQKAIESYGFKPIRNLTGHQIAKGTLHAGVSIPNVKSLGITGNKKLKEGATYAIEPFATDGRTGVVEDKPGSKPLIFSLDRSPKSSLGKIIAKKYQYKPFSARNAARFLKINPKERYKKIQQSAYKDGWHSYAPLIETSNGMVTQCEDTILVTKDGAEIITLGAIDF